jgi:hypothetical protein
MSKYNCKDQLCWTRTEPVQKITDNKIKEDIKHYTFRPNGPKKQHEWLSTTDINKVMKQYEMQHKNFLFLGALPYDFDELPYYNTQDLNFNELEKGKYKIGAVINLDIHTQSGSHWVALYANLDENKIYYFDSFGKKPGKRIRNFCNRIISYMNNNEKINTKDFFKKYKSSDKYDIRFNKTQHQFSLPMFLKYFQFCQHVF